MILFDFSGAVHASVYVDVAENHDVSKDFLRHLIVSQIRNINKKFHNEYGELVICADSKTGYWRNDIFPYYKASRKKAKQASPIDWNMVFTYVNEIVQEIKEYLPYKFIQIPKLEADDIIATLALNVPESDDLFEGKESVLIVSNDHDFRQLHNIQNVKQYFPLKKRIEHESNPVFYLFEHICRGDSGDGIPNIRSDADTFINENKRQKPVTTKFIKECMTNGVPEENKERYKKNDLLINLRNIPEEYKQMIINTYNEYKVPEKRKLLYYLASNNLKTNMDNIFDF